MRQQSIVYEKASGEVDDYDIEIISVDDRYIEARHDGMEKTFRRDRVIHILDADDDIEEVMADWQVLYEDDGDDDDDDSLTIDLADLDLAENTRSAAKPGAFARLAEAEQRARTKAEPAPQARKAEETETPQPKKKRIYWGSFWLGFAFSYVVIIAIAIFVPAS